MKEIRVEVAKIIIIGEFAFNGRVGREKRGSEERYYALVWSTRMIRERG